MQCDMTNGAVPRPLVRRRRVRVGATSSPRAVNELVDVEERALEAEVVLQVDKTSALSSILPPPTQRSGDVP